MYGPSPGVTVKLPKSTTTTTTTTTDPNAKTSGSQSASAFPFVVTSTSRLQTQQAIRAGQIFLYEHPIFFLTAHVETSSITDDHPTLDLLTHPERISWYFAYQLSRSITPSRQSLFHQKCDPLYKMFSHTPQTTQPQQVPQAMQAAKTLKNDSVATKSKDDIKGGDGDEYTRLVQSIVNEDHRRLLAKYPQSSEKSPENQAILRRHADCLTTQVIPEFIRWIQTMIQPTRNWLSGHLLGHGVYEYLYRLHQSQSYILSTSTQTQTDVNCIVLFEENGNAYAFSTRDIPVGEYLVALPPTDSTNSLPKEWARYWTTGTVAIIGDCDETTTATTTTVNTTVSTDPKAAAQSIPHSIPRQTIPSLDELKEKLYRFTQMFAPVRHELRQFIQKHSSIHNDGSNGSDSSNGSDDDNEDVSEFEDENSLPYRFITSYAQLLPELLKDDYTVFSLLVHVPVSVFPFYYQAWNHPENGFRILHRKMFDLMTRTASSDFRESFELPADIKRILE